jgi:hypothetical protein
MTAGCAMLAKLEIVAAGIATSGWLNQQRFVSGAIANPQKKRRH